MAYLFNGTTSKLVLASAPITAAPCTFAAFIKTTTLGGANQVILSVDDTLDVNSFILVLVNTTGTIGASAKATTSTTAQSAVGASVGKWAAASAIFTSSTSRRGGLDGELGTIGSTSKTPAGLVNTTIGQTAAGLNPFVGLLAEIAIWNNVLTPGELKAHALGVPASEIRPQALLLYLPLTSQLGIQDMGSNSLVFANTAVTPVSDHPRVFRPVKRKLRRSAFARTH